MARRARTAAGVAVATAARRASLPKRQQGKGGDGMDELNTGAELVKAWKFMRKIMNHVLSLYIAAIVQTLVIMGIIVYLMATA